MTAMEVLNTFQDINQRLAEMVNGDAPTRRQRHKDVIELVSKLCAAIMESQQPSKQQTELEVW